MLLDLFDSFAGCGLWNRFLRFVRLLRVRSEVEKIIHWVSEILLTSKIVFCGLDGYMPEQKLDLLKLTPAVVAQFRTGAPQVVWGNVF